LNLLKSDAPPVTHAVASPLDTEAKPQNEDLKIFNITPRTVFSLRNTDTIPETYATAHLVAGQPLAAAFEILHTFPSFVHPVPRTPEASPAASSEQAVPH